MLPAHLDGVRTDVLGDTACLGIGDMGVADGVQQRRLSMIDMAHDHHNGVSAPGSPPCPRCRQSGRSSMVTTTSLLHLGAQLHGHHGGRVVVDNLRLSRHDAHIIRRLTTSLAVTFKRLASSATTISSGMVISS